MLHVILKLKQKADIVDSLIKTGTSSGWHTVTVTSCCFAHSVYAPTVSSWMPTKRNKPTVNLRQTTKFDLEISIPINF